MKMSISIFSYSFTTLSATYISLQTMGLMGESSFLIVYNTQKQNYSIYYFSISDFILLYKQ